MSFVSRRFTRYWFVTVLISLLPVVVFASQLQPIQQSTCQNTPAPRLIAGEQGRVMPGISSNIRNSPGTNEALLGQIPTSGTFVVLEGPVCNEDFAWWRVDYNGLIGWIAEGRGSTYWLEPAGPLDLATATQIMAAPVCPGFLPSRLIVGEQGRVIPGPANNLRSEASSSAERLAQIPGGASFLILEGPLCLSGLAWWRVDYLGIVGWSAEGSGNEYWLEPAGPVPTPAPTLIPTITRTPAPTLTPTITPSPTPILPAINVPRLNKELLANPLPEDLAAIGIDNVSALRPIGIIGRGALTTSASSVSGQYIAVANSLGVWLNNLDERSEILFNIPGLIATHVTFSPDERYLAIGGRLVSGVMAQTVHIWDLQTEDWVSYNDAFVQDISSMVFHPRSQTLAVGIVSYSNRQQGINDRVFLFDMNNGRIQGIPVQLAGYAESMAISADGSTLALSEYSGGINLYSLARNQHQIRYEVQSNDGVLGQVGFSRGGEYLISAGGGGPAGEVGVLRVWNIATSQRIQVPNFLSEIDRFAISPDGTFMVVTSSGSQQAWLVDTEKFSINGTIQFPDQVMSIDFAVNGRLIISHRNGLVREWDLTRDRDEILLDYRGTDTNDRIAVSPDMRLVAITSTLPREVNVYDVQSWERLWTFDRDLGTVTKLDFSEDGSELKIVIGQQEYVWNVQTQEESVQAATGANRVAENPADLSNRAQSLMGRPPARVSAIPNSPLLLIESNNIVSFWNEATRQPLARYYMHGGSSFQFSPGNRLLIVGVQGAYILWGIPR